MDEVLEGLRSLNRSECVNRGRTRGASARGRGVGGRSRGRCGRGAVADGGGKRRKASVDKEAIEKLREQKWSAIDAVPVVPTFTGDCGLQCELPEDYEELDILDLILTRDFYAGIVEETNRYAAQHKQKLGDATETKGKMYASR